MATTPKIGGTNDRHAPGEAKKHVLSGVQACQRITEEIEQMRDSVGKPNYGPLERITADIATALALAVNHLNEMENIRNQNRNQEVDSAEAVELNQIVEGLQGQIQELAARCQALESKLKT